MVNCLLPKKGSRYKRPAHNAFGTCVLTQTLGLLFSDNLWCLGLLTCTSTNPTRPVHHALENSLHGSR